MNPGVLRKWRPPLGGIVFFVLLAVMSLPLAGLLLFRVYENQLIREAEAELIAQSTALAAVFALDAEAVPAPGLPLGVKATPLAPSIGTGPYRPIVASLDLTRDTLLPTRPLARPAAQAVDPGYAAIGERLKEALKRTQIVTLAGFRLLDPQGTVIAGRDETGQSLAHIEEVADALRGRYRAVLRTRIVDDPAPLYSLSRGTQVRVFVAMPVIVGDRVAGVVYASRTPNNVLKHLYGEWRKFSLVGLAILVATLIIGLVFWRTISGPIHALVVRAGEIWRGVRDDATLKHYGTREVALLAQSLTDTAQRLKQRSDYIATFAAHASHELKSPLTAIKGAAELLRDDCVASAPGMAKNDELRFLDTILSGTERAAAILNRLRELARADNPQTFGSVQFADLLADLQQQHPIVVIEAEGDPALMLSLSRENALIVFTHLVDNAARHGARTVRISAGLDRNFLRIVVADNGSGISDSNRDRIFDAFFTTRRESGGTGMGLGIVRAMLQAHGGSICLLPAQTGTAFEIAIRTG